MSIIARSRWLGCRIWRLLTFRTFLILTFCCIVLEITRGLPTYRQVAQKDEVRPEHSRNFDGKEIMQSSSKTTKDLQKLKWNVDQKSERKTSGWYKPLGSSQSIKIHDRYQAQSSKASYDQSFYPNRIIHFDLKGAAPKISYLKEVLKLIKANGATGILLEWEDTFPFSGILAENRNSDAYTVEEVRDLLKTAKSLKLDVIPLVPTFGHLEWILKVEKFRQYRQNDMFPQVICLTDDDGVSIVLEAIRQVVESHLPFGMTYFHIGADEAFQFGECSKDRRWLVENQDKGKDDLAAMHLAKIANYVKKLIPDVRVLAWYDMIKSFESSLVKLYRLDQLLEVVVWDYSETLQQQNVWGSSAFKGANEPSSAFLDLKHYFRNNKAWITHRRMYGTLFRTFRGLIITGWQRYDHFAVLCELLPVGLPSAVLNLLVAKAGDKFSTQWIINATTVALNCTSKISLEYMHSFDSCDFPGVELFNVIHSLHNRIEMIKNEVFDSHQVKGWLSRFNVRHEYTQLWYLVPLQSIIERHISELLDMTKTIQSLMQPIFRKSTIDEWLYEYVDPIREQLIELLQKISQLKMRRIFTVRNFDIRREQVFDAS
uniref:beta-N-acetylhexosaminidase n=1 Tax=Loa loa TaxID=7209 RepID=A0A1I7VSU0_LOALO